MAIWVLIIAIGLSDWVQFARVVRGATMVEKSKEYVQAARLIGRSPAAIMLRHILPNVLSPVLVIATISLALAIIAEATLSFLGVGAPPTEPSLGTLIRIGQGFLFSGEWWILFSGLHAAGAGAGGQPSGRLAARRANRGCADGIAGNREPDRPFPTRRQTFTAVRDAHLTVEPGQIHGLVGGIRGWQIDDRGGGHGPARPAGADHRRRHPLSGEEISGLDAEAMAGLRGRDLDASRTR